MHGSHIVHDTSDRVSYMKQLIKSRLKYMYFNLKFITFQCASDVVMYMYRFDHLMAD